MEIKKELLENLTAKMETSNTDNADAASIFFPEVILVRNEWRPNPYAERDTTNRRILAVHARAIAFRYSSMGIPQILDWTTIFDMPMIEKYPQDKIPNFIKFVTEKNALQHIPVL